MLIPFLTIFGTVEILFLLGPPATHPPATRPRCPPRPPATRPTRPPCPLATCPPRPPATPHLAATLLTPCSPAAPPRPPVFFPGPAPTLLCELLNPQCTRHRGANTAAEEGVVFYAILS